MVGLRNMNTDELRALEALRQKSHHLLKKLEEGQRECKSLIYGESGAGGLISKKTKCKIPVAKHKASQVIKHQTEPGKSKSYYVDISIKSPESLKIKTYASPSRFSAGSKINAYKPALDTSGLSVDESFHHKASPRLQTTKYTATDHTANPNQTLTSTPNQSTVTSVKNDTPKSILKRRKIIEDNVKVDSKYAHTPSVTPTRNDNKKRGLNYSYSDVDDLDIALENNKHHSDLFPPTSGSRSHDYSRPSNGSYIEEYLDTSVSDLRSEEKKHNSSVTFKKEVEKTAESEEAKTEELLHDQGNERRRPNIVTNFSQRPKSVVLSGAKDSHSKQSRSPGSTMVKTTTSCELPASLDSRLQPPLLGYDWIAGILDNEEAVYTKPDSFYEDISRFRSSHKEDCLSNPYTSNPLGLTRPVSPDVRDPTHTCIHGYEVNPRLFTDPVNADEKGRSLCPVCMLPRTEPTPGSPGFVRVSIPKSAIASPYERRPHRRSSFESADSCALSNHCLAGWECSKPSTLPTASTVDLQQAAKGIKAKQASTKEEAEKVAQSFSRFSKLTGGGLDPETLSLTYSRGHGHKKTSTGDGVLNRSSALEWELRTAPRDPPYIKRK